MFSLRRSKDALFYFCLLAENGQVLMTSETYTRKASAKRAAKRVIALLGKGMQEWEVQDDTANAVVSWIAL